MPSPATFGFNFPAIRGIQARREYFVSMCPLRIIPKIFLFDEEELSPDVRAQRTLNKGRIPEITRYVLENPDDYVFSAITASIDAEVSFVSVGESAEASKVGVLQVPMDARFIINDGQHRRAAIEQALRENPELGDESIAVVFFLDQGLARSQQMFADLNRHAVKPSRSLGVLYDHRDDKALLARLVVLKSPIFRDIAEMERSTLAVKSRKLFTLSAIYGATATLLDDQEYESRDKAADVAIKYWSEVAKQIPEWALVRDGKMSASEVRQDYLHSNALMLQVLGGIGRILLTEHAKDWKARLKPLSRIDWSRKNVNLWEGRALVGGRVSKSGQNVTLTRNLVKNKLKLPLTPEEKRAEESYTGSHNGRN